MNKWEKQPNGSDNTTCYNQRTEKCRNNGKLDFLIYKKIETMDRLAPIEGQKFVETIVRVSN